MSFITRRLRSLLIALVVLALSATAALAGRSALSNPHTQVASQTGDEQGEESEASDTDEAEAPDTEAPETDEADSPDADSDAPTGEHPDNHGLLVSQAAQSPTPDGFDNHGAYVRTIAQDNQGHANAAKHAKKH